MEGAYLKALDIQTHKPVAHLTGRARGEGDGEPAARIMGADADGVSDPIRHRAGLAGAGSGPDHDRPLDGFGHGPLLRIELIEQAGLHGDIVALGSDVAPAPSPREDPPMSITMYTTAWCGFCHRLKAQLGREGIEVTEVDIERDPDAAAFVEGVNGGNQTVPTLLFDDGSTMTNPSLAQVKAKLGV